MVRREERGERRGVEGGERFLDVDTFVPAVYCPPVLQSLSRMSHESDASGGGGGSRDDVSAVSSSSRSRSSLAPVVVSSSSSQQSPASSVIEEDRPTDSRPVVSPISPDRSPRAGGEEPQSVATRGQTRAARERGDWTARALTRSSTPLLCAVGFSVFLFRQVSVFSHVACPRC